MKLEPLLCLEQELFDNRCLVDVGRVHTSVRTHNVVGAAVSLVKASPALLRSEGQVQDGKHLDGCMECGMYRVLGERPNRQKKRTVRATIACSTGVGGRCTSAA
ncbi:ferredoxin family protein [Bradyrhizobium jicamae]|uniref:ferredoxin family protein n=1 Tax=Bradyrhizobium jicamae TaxID=280332 RepID=UPI0012EDBBC3|nr:ferredoxin family protein [Bradyrhizobium jicamae]